MPSKIQDLSSRLKNPFEMCDLFFKKKKKQKSG